MSETVEEPTPYAPTPVQKRIIKLIRDYRGLPLGVVDVVQELKIGSKTASEQLRILSRHGLIIKKERDRELQIGVLYFAPDEPPDP